MRIIKKTALFTVLMMLLALAMLMTVSAASGGLEIWDGTVAESFGGGDGTAENPYLISKGSELALLMQKINETDDEANQSTAGEYYKLTSDIYLNDISDYESWDDENAPENAWTPGGGVFNYEHIGFAGYFDGANYEIKGLYLSRNEQYNGLFGYAFNADIKNLGITHSYISGGQFTAAITGYSRASKRNVTISNCHVTDSKVYGLSSVGGLVGYLESCNRRTVVEKCSSNAYVKAKYDSAGGIVGLLAPYGVTYYINDEKDYIVKFFDCVNHGKINGNSGVGGIIGSAKDIVSSAFEYPEDDPRYVPPEKQPRTGVLLERCVNTGAINGSLKFGSVAGILGPIDRDDKFVEIDLVNCYGTKNGSPDLYGISRSTILSTASRLVEADEVGTRSTFEGFNFDKIWSITHNVPAIRRLGDVFNEGYVSGKGFFAALGLAVGTVDSSELELVNIDFNGDDEFTLSDLNSYIHLLRGKGAVNGFLPNNVMISQSSSRLSESEYLTVAFAPMRNGIENDIQAAKIYSIGDIIIVNEGRVKDRPILGNAFVKGTVLDTEDVSANGTVGYVELERYDAENGILKVMGSSTVYRLSDKTKVSFSEKSTETVRNVPRETLNTTAKSYHQDNDKNNPLRVLLCVSKAEDGAYDVHFAMIVRD